MADTPDPQELARRYLDLWQQHLTQAATDPELAAGMAKLMQALPAAAGATWPAWPVAGTGDVAQGDTERAAQGAASAGAASDDGGERFDELISRLDAIEKRLGALEQKPRASRKRTAKGSGKSRS